MSERDCIVFATDNRTGMALREILVNGFSYTTTANGNGDTVYALYDAISFTGYEDKNYPERLAQAISYLTENPVYLRLNDEVFEITTDLTTRIKEIPEPVPNPVPGMKGPGKGWLGATRDSLHREVKKFGKFALFQLMEDYLKNEKKNTERKRVTKEAWQKCKARVNQAQVGTPAYILIDSLRKPERCFLLSTRNTALNDEENINQTSQIAELFGKFGFKGYAISGNGSDFICAVPSFKGQAQGTDFLLSCAHACQALGIIVKQEDNRFFKILCSDPETDFEISASLPINKE